MSNYAEILIVIETNEDYNDVNVNCYVEKVDGDLEYGGIKATTNAEALCGLISNIVEKKIKSKVHDQWVKENKPNTP